MKMKTLTLSLMTCLAATVGVAAELPELAKNLPVTFAYDGKPFKPEEWKPAEKKLDAENSQMIYTSPDGKLRLTVTYRQFADFPVIETHPVLECVGDEPTAIVDDFKSLHFRRACNSNGVKVRRVTGTKCNFTDFTRHDVLLQRRHECDWLHLTTDEGMSTSTWLPYFGIDFDPMNGVEMAIGWTGAWRADMQYGGEFWLTTGTQDSTHFKMLPGEKFIMPYVVIYERRNKSVEDGLVEFHRFIIEHKTPRDANGKIFEPLMPVSASGGNKTDANMLKIIDFVKNRFKIPFDVFWVDANWYGKHREVVQDTNCGADWFQWAGDWHPNTWSHPDGNLKKVSDAAHDAGMRFLVWFEPERATELTQIVKDHPEYFHRTKNNPGGGHYLLDLGNPDALKWIVEEVSRNIRESGIDIYRQDFNWGGLSRVIWHDMDAEDRKCVAEIKHINGLWAFWDELHRRFPNLMFENCASGGRRMDIEMMSRSHSYCRDDAHMAPNCDELTQNITMNTTPYIPFTGGETFTVPVYDTYAFLSRLGAGTVFTPTDFQGMILKREPPEAEIEWFRKVFAVAFRMRPYYFGDFYALTDASYDGSDIYAGYQLNDAKKGEGFFSLFRRAACPEDTFHLKLRGIDPDATYVVEEFEGQTVEMKGSDFARQTLTFPNPRTYKVVFYKKK
ncbi:MAG: alpha-galactosidase [Victivallales bacterium]|nr:alpha-galactosidase [Victivallales bacterium]